MPIRKNVSTAELRKHFDFFDDNKDGRIDMDEYIDLLKIMGADIRSHDSEGAFSGIDADGDGVISFGEFAAWWRTGWYMK